MSGFEVAGIVLGALPLIITALQGYADGVQTLEKVAKYKLQADILITQLTVVQSSFRNTCEKLLLRVERHTEDFTSLEEHDIQFWKNPDLDQKLKNDLGFDYESCKRLLYQVFIALDSFRAKLGLAEDYLASSEYMEPYWFKKDPKQSLQDRVVLKLTTAGKAVKLGFKDGEYGKIISAIGNGINALEKVLLDQKELETLRYNRQRKQNAILRAFARDAIISLYSSIRWGCPCSSEHTVNLHLRIQQSKNSHKESDKINVLFASLSNSKPSRTTGWIWRQAEIEPKKIAGNICNSVFKATADLFPESLSSSNLTFCQALNDAPPTPQCIGYIECQRYQHHIYASNQDTPRVTRTLRDVLIQRNSIRPRRQIRALNYGIKERHRLSLILAYNVLQLYDTPWLQESWSNRDIYFISDNDFNQDPLSNCLYVSEKEPTQSNSIHNEEIRPWLNSTVCALGVLLLELTFDCPLECIPPAPADRGLGGRLDGFTEYRKALRLATLVEHREGREFATAIDRCLRFTVSIRDSRFPETFYNDVIQPLEACLNSMR